MVIFSILQTEKQRLIEIKPFAQVIEQGSDSRARSSRAQAKTC